jgi:FkbM family methyltransferase
MKENGKQFLIYGNMESPLLSLFLNCLEIRLSGVIDDDPMLQGAILEGKGKVITLKELEENKEIDSFNYLIGIEYCNTLKNKLLKLGVDKKNVMWINWGGFGFETCNDVTYMVENYKGFKENIVLFDDEKSKMQYWEMCKFRMDYNESRLQSIDIDAYNQYFDPIIEFSENEVYVDVGAYDGKTIEKFIDRVNGKYNEIIAIEASPKNTAVMKERLRAYRNIKFLQCAIIDQDKGQVEFVEGLGPNSKIDTESQERILVPATSIDSIVDKKVTYIKADIEGAESLMLDGMRMTIKKYRPKLAICIYHSEEDMLELPRKIVGLCENYRFYFRQHGEGLGESVMYAIPN